jgi:hypothetical protein
MSKFNIAIIVVLAAVLSVAGDALACISAAMVVVTAAASTSAVTAAILRAPISAADTLLVLTLRMCGPLLGRAFAAIEHSPPAVSDRPRCAMPWPHVV